MLGEYPVDMRSLNTRSSFDHVSHHTARQQIPQFMSSRAPLCRRGTTNGKDSSNKSDSYD